MTIVVCEIPPADRHPTSHDPFAGLESGRTLTLISDHEPKPLFYEMQAEVGSFDTDGYSVDQFRIAELWCSVVQLNENGFLTDFTHSLQGVLKRLRRW